MKSCLLWGYMHINLGDDLFFKVLFERYKNIKFYIYPPSEFLNSYKKIYKKYKNVIFYDNEDYYIELRKKIPDEKTPLYIFPMVLERAKTVDLFINVGGSIFMQNDNWKNDDRLKIKEIIASKPSFILGCNFGPGNKEYYEYYKNWFKNFDDICFRDENSYNKFKDLDNVRLADDIVLIDKKKKFQFNLKKKNTLGISVINANKKYKKNYIDFLVNTIKFYRNRGMKITLFSFCECDGDLRAINEIISKIEDKKNINIVNYKDNISLFLSKWRSNEYIISTRFHATILAIKYKQKFLPLSYSDKTKNYLKDIYEKIKFYDLKNLNYSNLDEMVFSKVDKDFNSEKQFEQLDKYLTLQQNDISY